MLTLTEIFTIIIVHWIADFWLQTDWQATNKSKNIKALFQHTFNYSMCWFIPISILLVYFKDTMPINSSYNAILFVLITFIAHTITDYFTSRLNSYLWDKRKTHYFFVSIGGDQILHYIQLFTTYYYLKQ